MSPVSFDVLRLESRVHALRAEAVQSVWSLGKIRHVLLTSRWSLVSAVVSRYLLQAAVKSRMQ